jgi:hypothetical protein
MLNLKEASETNLSVILSLPRDFPGITHLNFEESNDDDSVSDAVCQWNELRSFAWKNSNRELTHHLIHLANLSNLQDLSIRLPELDSPSWQIQLSSFHQLEFRALRTAQFRCQNISSCRSFMDLVSSQCPIESLTVDIHQGPDAISLRNFCQTLNARYSPMTFTKLSIICDSNRWSKPPFADQDIIDEETFQPLLGFPNMRHVTIDIPRPFALGNKILKDITECWPQLQLLAIGSLGGWGGHSQVTLAGLIPLLSLPTLGWLRIVVNASSVDIPLMPKTEVPNTKLSKLHLGDSVIHDAPSVAACLSDVLPNVTEIRSWGDTLAMATIASVSVADVKNYQSRWGEVVSLMKAAKVQQGRDCVGDVLP